MEKKHKHFCSGCRFWEAHPDGWVRYGSCRKRADFHTPWNGGSYCPDWRKHPDHVQEPPC